MVMYYGWYSNRSRGERKKAQVAEGVVIENTVDNDRPAANRTWAMLIKRVYEVDPLQCPECGGEMKVVAFIIQRSVITRILDHVRNKKRAPP